MSFLSIVVRKKRKKDNNDKVEPNRVICVYVFFSFPFQNHSLLVGRHVEVPMVSAEGRMQRYIGHVAKYQKTTKMWFVKFEDDTQVRGKRRRKKREGRPFDF